MDAHQRFKNVISRWFGLTGFAFGHDVLRPHPKIYGCSVVAPVFMVSVLMCCIWTFYFYDDDKAIDGGSFFFVTLKVIIKFNKIHKHKLSDAT